MEPGSRHLEALIDTVALEQRPIAERLAVGGLPAVRKALSDEQARAKAEGRPAGSGEPIVALAEKLLPDVRAAVWLDRAEAAVQHLDELGLRDLRATLAAAEPRTDEGRELQRVLKDGLERRVTKLRQDWEEHLRQALSDGRVLQALRLSARPPEPTARFPGALVEPLAAQAGAAMTAETAPERWLALLEAAVASPVRRQIKPAGIPEDPAGELSGQARLAAGRIPALAPLLGMTMPPPPKPLPGERPARRIPRPPRASGPRAAVAALPSAVGPPAEETPADAAPGEAQASAAEVEAPAEAAMSETQAPVEMEAPATEAAPSEAEAEAPAEMEAPAPAEMSEQPSGEVAATESDGGSPENSVVDEPVSEPVDEG